MLECRFFYLFPFLHYYFLKRTPVWWRWYHWANPAAWTLYGLLASQFGDVRDVMDTKQSVQDFLASYFGFRHDMIGVVAVVVVGFAAFFVLLFASFIRTFNFQRR
ncbi:putative pleiotropic drug resistance protein 7 [Phtheirospermum japonicum]|uniref:Putative pleiotropic drug resistance protein 7 n=1 Tax=Phtheirospermum japonicum TaxID=374723 RepID=A0A830CQY6_9LAMI|nr:putative pleiotropic drug resistance protein 7 [Phtheirospermum japonicum]